MLHYLQRRGLSHKMPVKTTDKPAIRLHMRRFRAPLLQRTNRQLTYLHIYLGMSIQQIAHSTGIARKTTERILLGQRPTLKQLRKLQRTVLTAAIELEKLVPHTRRSRAGMYHQEILMHLANLGRLLSRESKER